MAQGVTHSSSSKITEAELDEFAYPFTPAFNSGFMETADGPTLREPHRIFYQQFGNPTGEPVMFIHGGPGGGATDNAKYLTRFFNPERYQVNLFDQRGCGGSTPSVAVDPKAALTNNTTDYLVSDIVNLRDEFGIKGKMHVFGGSWGMTLGMKTLIQHSELVQTWIPRGAFLGRRADVRALYQGPDVGEKRDVHNVPPLGTYLTHPEAWRQFIEVIPKKDRGDLIAAYAKIFDMEPKNEAERQYQLDAVKAWSTYEFNVSYLKQKLQKTSELSDEEARKAIDMGRIEMHYFRNNMFFPSPNHLLDHVHVIAKARIPIHLVQGRYDVVCPPYQAEDLDAAFTAAGSPLASYTLTTAGHSMLCRENFFALKKVMDELPPMTAYDLGQRQRQQQQIWTPPAPGLRPAGQ